MKVKKIIVASFAASVLLTNIAFAREVTQSELAALSVVAHNYREATVSANADALLAGIPPRVIAILTDMSKPVNNVSLTTEQVKENIKRDIISFTDLVKIISWDVDLKAKKAGTLDVTDEEKNQNKSGNPFFIIPSTTVVEVKVKKQNNEGSNSQGFELKKQKIISDVIAVMDEGKWYILSADNPMQLLVYQRAFPGIEKAILRQPELIDVN